MNKTRASQDDLATKRLSAIRAARSQIKRAMREEYVRVSEHAIYLLKQDRDKEYQALLARQRGDKHDLKQDQAERRRRYDLLANYGKASANDNRENGKDREAANNNRPAFEMTSQIVRAINRRELDRVDVSKYIAQARRAYHVNQAISANPKHPDAHELDDASRRAIASINTALHKRRAEEKRRRILAAQPPVRGAIRKAALELRSRGRGKENQREGQQEKQTSKDVPVNVLVRRAWEAIQRERERSDLQQGRTAHGGPGETRDRGGGMER